MSSSADQSPLVNRLTTLGDLARLRTLRLLAREELSVGEIASSLQLPQSTVSRHLKILYENGWIVRRTSGTASLYRLDMEALDRQSRQLWQVTQQQIGDTPTFEGDDLRLAGVLRDRRVDSKQFFGRLGGEWDELRQELFGTRFTSHALLHLIDPTWTVADLGCGTGNAAQLLAPIVKEVIAVDREPAMLDAAKRRLESFDNIDFREGALEQLPIDDGSVDAAVLFLVLHHLEEPVAAVTEMSRVLRSGGVAMIVDMIHHDRGSYRRTMGHKHLGFDHDDVTKWANKAGMNELRFHQMLPDTGSKGPGLFVATMRK